MFSRLPLKVKLLIVSSFSLILTVAIIVSWGYYANYQNTMNVYREAQEGTTTIISSVVYEYILKYETAAMSYGEAFMAPDTASVKELYYESLDRVHNELKLISTFLAFDDGTLIRNKAHTLNPGYDHKTRGWYKNGMQSKGIYISPIYKGANSGLPIVTITYPIQTNDGTRGLIAFNINVDLVFLNNFANKEVDGNIYALDNNLAIISSEDSSLILKKADEVWPKELVSYLSSIKDQSNDIVRYFYNGSNRIAYAVKVPDISMIMLYTMNRDLMVYQIKADARSSIIFSLVLLLLANGLMYGVIQLSLRDVINIQKQITEVATNKDLSIRITVATKDELGQIAIAVNGLLSGMDKVVGEVRNSIIEVASANNELAATMDELSTTFSHQAHQVAEMVNAMGDISEVSRTTSDALSSNMSSLEQTADVTRTETEKLDKVSVDMAEIEQDTVSLAETIRHLSESSSEIGNILGVINDIANQTNLLALNAAIEAARAGEAGRGFAVVADEVRKLAERTQDATKEIETIITGLQQESEKASQAMDKSIISVQEGSGNISNVTSEIKRAVEQVTHLYTDMRPVSDSVSNQYDMVQHVVDNTRNISAGIEESTSAVSEVNNTVNHLQQRTESLKQLIEQFKV